MATKADMNEDGGRVEKAPFLPNVNISKAESDGTLSISQMAEAFNVTHRTLHFYEEKKLLFPSRRGVRRVYPPDQIERMSVVHACREAGIPVADIQLMMAKIDNAENQDEADAIFAETMRAQRDSLYQQYGEWMAKLNALNTIIDELGDNNPVVNDNETSSVPLTELEKKCIVEISNGLNQQLIAHKLNMQIDDVGRLEKAIVDKFASEDRFQAAAKAMLLGLVTR